MDDGTQDANSIEDDVMRSVTVDYRGKSQKKSEEVCQPKSPFQSCGFELSLAEPLKGSTRSQRPEEPNGAETGSFGKN